MDDKERPPVIPAAPDRPLLIETLPGEDRGSDLAGIGQALAFLGGVVLVGSIVLGLLAFRSLSEGWQGAWFRPGSDFVFVIVAALGAMWAGLAMYFLGCRLGRGRRRA